MKVIKLTTNIDPVAKARARTAVRNGVVRSYTPERTQVAQDTIKALLEPYRDQCFPPHIPIKLTCTFYRHKSIWLPKKEHLPFRKPDLDNFLKLLLDSMNGILVADDAQITSIVMSKRWSSNGEGYITVRLEEDIE
jgi:Holliday junction resolvase RusA-like endonuclease